MATVLASSAVLAVNSCCCSLGSSGVNLAGESYIDYIQTLSKYCSMTTIRGSVPASATSSLPPSASARLSRVAGPGLSGRSLCTSRCSRTPSASGLLPATPAASPSIGRASRSPICRPASGLQGRDTRQDATSTKGRRWSSRRRARTRTGRRASCGLQCFAGILFARL